MSSDVLHVEEQLKRKEEEFHGKDDFLGITLLGFPKYTSATRLTMFTNHLKQFNVLKKGEFAKVFGNYENVFGQLSSALVKARKEYEVVAKVEKFPEMPGYLYALFVYNKDDDEYDVIFKKRSEELSEKFGYEYQTEVLDSYKVGDIIPKDQVIYKSTSYDEDNNYCYGKNAKVAYILDPGNIEDAYVISESFAQTMISHKVTTIKIPINDNDFLLNLYGDSKHHQCFPNIGERVKHRLVAAVRRIINDQVLYDMKKSNMMRFNPSADKPYFSRGADAIVTDVDIYCNKQIDEIRDTDENKQILYYLRNQQRYFKELNDVCNKIVATGRKYSDDVGFIKSRSDKILDPSYLWKDSETAFSNIIMEIRVEHDVKLFSGSKITGRYGDKGVISEIRKDEDMPFLEDGTRVDIIKNPLSCPNRLNPFQLVEVQLNHDANQLIKRKIIPAKNHEERWKILQEFIKYFNEKGELDKLREYYNSLSTKEEVDKFWESVKKDGIYIHYPPMWDSEPAFVKLWKLNKEFGFTREQVYVNKFGRKIPIMRKLIVGEEYMIKMKQTAEKNFSARSTGSLSQQGLPEKSNKVRTNELLYSTTPITLGRDENNNQKISVHPFILCKMHLFYRTSPFARREMKKIYTTNVLNFKKFKIKPGFKNRNVEQLNAKLKAIGAKIDFGFDGLRIDFDDGILHPYEYKGVLYVCSEQEMRDICLDDILRPEFEKRKFKGSKKELEKKYQEFKQYQISEARGNLMVKFDDGID